MNDEKANSKPDQLAGFEFRTCRFIRDSNFIIRHLRMPHAPQQGLGDDNRRVFQGHRRRTWCSGQDLNLHGRFYGHQHLKLACLPIPPPEHLNGRIDSRAVSVKGFPRGGGQPGGMAAVPLPWPCAIPGA
jgi:hypothetical protein